MENRLEDLIDLHGNYDRMVLRWLCHHVGVPRLGRAAAELSRRPQGGKPDLVAVCRKLGVRPLGRMAGTGSKPSSSRKARDRTVGDRYLARIRQILDAPKGESPAGGQHKPARDDRNAKEGSAAPVRQGSLPFAATPA
ncbi:hypothetical protein [Cupriavidus sp. AU9028]|uniref:hypothetical protein n=1 Tax=Cupriavidus sp. AU9028 TaxID=2871157 RepID=UPI001C951FEA|nr:hypothetical protein [Cupriavidus sp. AU9028]MBY4896129.1 hypothetical protein [Cupriavidus sp. AU9028]